MRKRRQLAPPPDPDIALLIRHHAMDGRDIGRQRRQQHDRVRRAVAEGVRRHLPVRPVCQDVAADQAAQRHEGHALLGRLQHGVDGRAGRVAHPDRPRLQRRGEARREARLAERDRAGLHLRHAAGADQQVGGEAGDGHAEQPQPRAPRRTSARASARAAGSCPAAGRAARRRAPRGQRVRRLGSCGGSSGMAAYPAGRGPSRATGLVMPEAATLHGPASPCAPGACPRTSRPIAAINVDPARCAFPESR
jgi:hypothetical protein